MTKFKYSTISTLLSVSIILTSQSAFAQSCASCQEKQKGICGHTCDNAKNRLEFETCTKNCVQSKCAEKCGNQTSDPGSTDSNQESTCRSCLDKFFHGQCAELCDPQSPKFHKCKTSCAKRKCNSQCSLPDAGSDNENVPGKYDCESCLEEQEQVCRGSEYCDPESPSVVACIFKCTQDRCAEKCQQF